jgi:hypothetical protein
LGLLASTVIEIRLEHPRTFMVEQPDPGKSRAENAAIKQQ